MFQILYIFFAIFPYFFGDLKEWWLRRISRNWNRVSATVDSQTITRSWTTNLEIQYRFEISSQPYIGVSRRRYLMSGSAAAEPVYEAGASIEVLVDPANPERSYFPQPLGIWGFVYASAVAMLTIIFAIAALYGGWEKRQADARNRIASTEWHSVSVPPLFDVSFPCRPSMSTADARQFVIGPDVPQARILFCSRSGHNFTLTFYNYKSPLSPGVVFTLFRKWNSSAAATARINERPIENFRFSSRHPVLRPGVVGRLFQETDPAWAEEIYVARTVVFQLETDWTVASDVKAFFDSFVPPKQAL